MLKLAVASRLPLIRVETDDPVNIEAVLSEIAGVEVEQAPLRDSKKVEFGRVYYVIDPKADWNALYSVYVQKKATLIAVNCNPHLAFFDAGFITAPKTMIRKFVATYAKSHMEAKKIAEALSGLSFKQAVEISQMAMTSKGQYTVEAIQEVRREFFGSVRGLELVNCKPPIYQSPEFLVNWVQTEGRFVFRSSCPEILRPRGLLFGGKAGTGKTMGAKYIARALAQPLYRLDIGIVMSKWAGESEQNLMQALRQAENCAPCILLFDEVEKLFTGTEESGVVTRLLASLLWWLQEHTARVFTIMTTNKEEMIPPELVRPGRIDEQITFPEMSAPQANDFATWLYGVLGHIVDVPEAQRTVYFSTFFSHAQVTADVLGSVKAAILDKPNADGYSTSANQ
jgi:hypothetical protein